MRAGCPQRLPTPPPQDCDRFSLTVSRFHIDPYICFCVYMAYPALDERPQPEHYTRSSPRRFNRLLNSVLGSPFVTTSDLPPDTLIVGRLAADEELEAIDGAFSAVLRTETVTRPPSPTPSFSTDTYSFVNWTENAKAAKLQPRPSLSDATPACAFLAGPSRRAASQAYPTGFTYTPYNTVRASTPSSMKVSRSVGILPRIWEVLRESSPAKKGRRRVDSASDFWAEFSGEGYIDYASLPPLDGEEGELIDDEACFIDVRSVTGVGTFLTVHQPFFPASSVMGSIFANQCLYLFQIFSPRCLMKWLCTC